MKLFIVLLWYVFILVYEFVLYDIIEEKYVYIFSFIVIIIYILLLIFGARS